MNYQLDLNDLNKVTVMLVQALWGAISSNFRMVALNFSKPVWELLFVLEREDASDLEEIEDVIGEFDALLLGLNAGVLKFEAKTILSTAPLPVVDPSSWRIVFRRREV